MKFPVDLTLFEANAHSPSFLSLQRSMGRQGLRLYDFCIPVNPYFPTPCMFAAFHEQLETVLKYYPTHSAEISQVLAEALELSPESVVVANGSTELITWIDLLLVEHSLATPVPTFGRWTDHPQEIGKRVHLFPLDPAENFTIDVDAFIAFVRATRARAVALCNPNNPTAGCLPRAHVLRLLDELADLDLVVIDESFIDFAETDAIPTVSREVIQRPNAIVLKSLGKSFGLHGVRAGFAVANARLATTLRRALPHWNVNGVAEMLIRDFPHHLPDYELSRRQVIRDRCVLEERLRSIRSLTVFPSRANFVFVRVPEAVDGTELRNVLLTEFGCLVRECGNKLGCDHHYFRIAARPAEQVEFLIESFNAALEKLSPQRWRAKSAPPGTTDRESGRLPALAS